MESQGEGKLLARPSQAKLPLYGVMAVSLVVLLLASAVVSSFADPSAEGAEVVTLSLSTPPQESESLSSGGAGEEGGGTAGNGGGGARACTVDDLVPPHGHYEDGGGGDGGDDLSGMWDKSSMVAPPFDCTCSGSGRAGRALNASYFCPNLGTGGYPKWSTSGGCERRERSALQNEPLPPGFRVLFYGNSHLRQVVEGIVCAYSSSIRSRCLRVVVDGESLAQEDTLVDEDLQCRSCVYSRKLRRTLLEHECISEDAKEEACRCDDDESVFEFDNGAAIHYHFAHKEENKRFEDALQYRGTEYSSYDAVVGNLGNDPRMEVSEVLRVANLLKEEGVPLFWTSAYEGEGDVGAWLPEEQALFWDSGARFVPVHRMVKSLKYLTKGVVEGENNPHFCMPGPPNEIGILLLEMAWAVYAERGGAARGGEEVPRIEVEGNDGSGKEEEEEGGTVVEGGGEDGGARARSLR
ncbi:hypothetical protein Esi_0048_0094 [Ectocarpus siliculosus]|uniref:Uncharacterized protein n=1 Tax=Ectocarpus siliculosus TaxID=2880 RepID=D7G2P7_ECTSI|nr:hypothetical protein Esi_0048_0094 [Ectocarpus siliculosus]|eukprot:CBJ26872.1 hypothetical protein Esi_0048_0094 [Ectocarpus siliculosus]